MAAGIVRLAGAVQTTDPPYIEATYLVDCGSSNSGSGRFRVTGTHCSSSSDTDAKKVHVISDANTEWDNLFSCYCADEGGGDCGDGTLNDESPFAEEDCTFSVSAGCQGNPNKWLHSGECIKFIEWTLTCPDC